MSTKSTSSLATDCGSTTTKAILIEKVDGVYRQTFRGEAPTTVEEPVADVTVGVINAATEVGELAGRRLVNEQGELIRPARDGEGCDIYISTSSAGGGSADDGRRHRPRNDRGQCQAGRARSRGDRDGRDRRQRQAASRTSKSSGSASCGPT